MQASSRVGLRRDFCSGQVICSGCGKDSSEVAFSGDQKDKGADAARYCKTCAAIRQAEHLSGLNKERKQQASCQLVFCRPCALTSRFSKERSETMLRDIMRQQMNHSPAARRVAVEDMLGTRRTLAEGYRTLLRRRHRGRSQGIVYVAERLQFIAQTKHRKTRQEWGRVAEKCLL